MDINDDRILQPREAITWIRLYYDPEESMTVGERDKFFRKTVRPLILGDSY